MVVTRSSSCDHRVARRARRGTVACCSASSRPPAPAARSRPHLGRGRARRGEGVDPRAGDGIAHRPHGQRRRAEQMAQAALERSDRLEVLRSPRVAMRNAREWREHRRDSVDRASSVLESARLRDLEANDTGPGARQGTAVRETEVAGVRSPAQALAVKLEQGGALSRAQPRHARVLVGREQCAMVRLDVADDRYVGRRTAASVPSSTVRTPAAAISSASSASAILIRRCSS